MVFAQLDWTSIFIGGAIGSILSAFAGLLVASLFQARVDQFIAGARKWLPFDEALARPLDGIWRSRHEYTVESSEAVLIDEHFLLGRERRGQLSLKSISRKDVSTLTAHLEVNGAILTGSWREHTPNRREYYGVCQFELDPTRDKADGLWTGFSRSRGVLSGIWTLQREDYRSNRRTRTSYINRDDLAWRKPLPRTEMDYPSGDQVLDDPF